MTPEDHFDNLSLRATEFTVTDDHLKLLRRSYVSWDDIEFGAACIDPKRPYGNSDVIGDIGEILGHWTPDDAPDDGPPESIADTFGRLHAEAGIALQIALHTGQFKAGRYVRERFGDWHAAEDTNA